MGGIHVPFSGKHLQELRTKAGLSQSQLAEKAGVKVASLRGWEIDRRQPKTEALLALAQALGVELAELVAPPASKKGRARKRT
jgi:transcriptional regulator with XRE-family HTH domain